MAYTEQNYATKKALREALASGTTVRVYQPGPFGLPGIPDGRAYLEGPHYPAAHTWYASCDVLDGCVVAGSVK
jgi:hypothetical protein